MCIGGELEHHKALSPSARKNRAVCSALTRGGIYRHLIGPRWWHEPGLKGSLWSRFKPPTGTNGGGPGARPIGPGSSHQPGPKGPDEPGPMAHVAALLSVLGENIVDKERTGINGITRAEP